MISFVSKYHSLLKYPRAIEVTSAMPTEAEFQEFVESNKHVWRSEGRVNVIKKRWPDKEDQKAHYAWSMEQLDKSSGSSPRPTILTQELLQLLYPLISNTNQRSQLRSATLDSSEQAYLLL